MNEREFVDWAIKQVQALDAEKLRFAQIPGPISISPIYLDAEFEIAMMDVPGVSTQRIAKFRAVRKISFQREVWKWQFDGIDRL